MPRASGPTWSKRPYITAGFTAFVLMIPLAITSTAGWIRRMGGKKWNLLHRLIYITALAAVLHYFWKVKLDTDVSRLLRHRRGGPAGLPGLATLCEADGI